MQAGHRCHLGPLGFRLSADTALPSLISGGCNKLSVCLVDLSCFHPSLSLDHWPQVGGPRLRVAPGASCDLAASCLLGPFPLPQGLQMLPASLPLDA